MSYWYVADTWKTKEHEKKFGKDRQIWILDRDCSVASICHVASIPATSPAEVHKKNLSDAQKIAAAPELLAALKSLMEMDPHCPFLSTDSRYTKWFGMFAAARVAVAKAEGRS